MHHPRFFILISEMRRPQDAMKVSMIMFHTPHVPSSFNQHEQAAWVLQGLATTFYAVFSVVVYVYIGSAVASPALFSLPPVWDKITFAVGMVNFLM